MARRAAIRCFRCDRPARVRSILYAATGAVITEDACRRCASWHRNSFREVLELLTEQVVIPSEEPIEE